MSDLGRLVADRYLLVERVGSGGMGTVWRAEDRLLGRHVALKKLHIPPHLQDDEVRTLYERTRREARSAARIAHPNVIVVHDVLDDEGLPCIVMEYIPSLTLSDVLKQRGPLPPAEAARVGLAMASALRAAHDARVLHRDVKPGNVLLGDGGRIVLTDFGIAMESGTSSLTKPGELIGSIRYLAPERLKGAHPETGPASDLWALGATLYQAVEGRDPFRRATAIETAYAIATDPYDPPRSAGELAPVIEGLLVKEPGRRMDVHEVERRLADVADGRVSGVESTRTRGGESTGRSESAGWRNGAGRRDGADEPTLRERTRTRTEPTQHTAVSGTDSASTDRPERAGESSGRGNRRRTVLWSVLAVTLVACLAAGTLWWLKGRDAEGSSAHGSGADRPTSSASAPSSGPTTPPPMPSGYHLEDAGSGLSVPVPDGWKPKTLPGGELAYVDPTGLVGLRVNVVEFAGTDPVQHWRETEEEQTRRDNPGYERVRMASTTFRGRPAGYWEFTFDGTARKFRAAELAFASDDGTQYVIYLSAPNARWHEYRPVFENATNGARVQSDKP
ncbi:serine/threonine-protein kinase [Streptomyces chartreusis]|uniref:serine/threonine-protein kinase n=1 Tax=Streptomyces chartreusis TaxID=1969 RepID=UPI00123DEE77|nr:serine/threonine-protein kinase [Streptomyces chartreusis]QEV69076.1 serine/threonine protein kinase [Streptomyces chartreusis]GGX45514.1 serine/threonine protein kinase [Streptomyces chartreusis]